MAHLLPLLVLATTLGSSATSLAQSVGGPLMPLPVLPQVAAERVELGRKLFFDPRLSSNNLSLIHI